MDRAERVGILHQRAEDLVVELELLVIADDHFDPERVRAAADDVDGLRMTGFRDEEDVAAILEPVRHRHRFGGGGGFVEQRGVGDVERGEVGDHRLEIQQRFEPALRNFGLIGRVCVYQPGFSRMLR